MRIERAILIAFLGNYLANNVLAGLVALLPASASGGIFTVQYVTYVVLAAILVAVLAWWYFAGRGSLKSGIIFGAIGFVVAIVTAFVTGVSGVLTQTGSLAQVAAVLPNFGPFLMNMSTVVLLGYWLIPSALVGWWLSRGSAAPVQTM